MSASNSLLETWRRGSPWGPPGKTCGPVFQATTGGALANSPQAMFVTMMSLNPDDKSPKQLNCMLKIMLCLKGRGFIPSADTC